MRKFINILVLVVALVGSVSAQSLDDLRKKAYDLSIEAINKGKNRKSAYEEYLEKQELEAAKKAEEEALEAKKTVDISKFSKFSKLSQLKNIDMQQVESSEDPIAELQRQLMRECTQLSNKVDFMRDDGNTYKKFLHFAPAIEEYIYCYIVGYNDGTFYLVMEYKNEEVFFQSQILKTEIWFNEDGDPLFSDAPGIALKIQTKLDTIVILDDVDSSYDYFVIWFED